MDRSTSPQRVAVSLLGVICGQALLLGLLANGKTNKEIATLLGITVRTVETHRSKIMLKLGLHSVVYLICYAMRNGTITERGG
jgi:DNA-binding NarL/FixJ family response regulator